MSREKQIEEMARAMCSFSATTACRECSDKCFFKVYAKKAISAGYRKQSEGEWITDEEGYVTCSNCGEEHTWDEFRPPYCDMCGAKMKGGAE